MSEAYLHIGAVAQRTGVSEVTLRAWERRYGVLDPARSPGGQRLYSDADVARVLRMRSFIDRGLRAGQAARMALSGDGERAEQVSDDAATGFCAQILAAATRFDEPALHDVLDEALDRFSLLAVLERVMLPSLRTLGERWERGEIGIAVEHFASNAVRGRLLAIAGNWGAGAGPLVIAACAPGEEHDLPLLILCLALREDGWRVRFLGARTPAEQLVDAVRVGAPRLVLVSAMTEEAARSFAVPAGLNGTPLVSGGAGYDGAAPRELREAVCSLRQHGFAGA
jgi:MerR family transcriptional regulator, light-induced transcriptional regulator